MNTNALIRNKMKLTKAVRIFTADIEGRRGDDPVVVGLTTTYAISTYHHESFEFESRSWQDILDTTLCDKACQ